MNTPTLVCTFATVVLGGVTLTHQESDQDPPQTLEAEATPQSGANPQTSVAAAPKPGSGIFLHPKEEILPAGVTRIRE